MRCECVCVCGGGSRYNMRKLVMVEDMSTDAR